MLIIDSDQEIQVSRTSNTTFDWVQSFLEPSLQLESLGCIGTLEVQRRLGQGSMGVVLLAWDTALERQVAIKVLKPELLDDQVACARFLREARAAAAVVHPNLMSIHAVGKTRGLPYFVMPYVEGGSLETLLQSREPWQPERLIRYALQLVAGLAAAHEAGLIHRDIKPGNILVDRAQHRWILADFGLVAQTHTDSNLTIPGNPLGTANYISPEQAFGDEVDHRSDLYSLGVLLYRLATGHDPFEEDTAWSLMLKHATIEPTPPSRLLSVPLPDALEQLILQLLAKEPGARPASASEVSARLVSMQQTPLSDHERRRLKALQQLQILDSDAEQAFDDIVSLASYICDTPIANISFVDEERQWFKARVGVDAQETHRNLSFVPMPSNRRGCSSSPIRIWIIGSRIMHW